MKRLTFFFSFLILFVSCKPTTNIITSKSVALKRGIYSTDENKYLTKKITTSRSNPKKEVAKKVTKKTVLNTKNDDDYVIHVDNSSYLVKQLINSASSNLGANYKSGGTTSDGFDCSGLMYSTFKKFDIALPRSSNEMSKIGRKLSNDAIEKGDLIFFKTNGKSTINHVGMVTEVTDEEIKFIHSATSSGVIISSTKEPYYGRTFAQANRILE